MNFKCDMHCIHLAEDRDKWWAVVYTAVYRRILKMWGISSLASDERMTAPYS